MRGFDRIAGLVRSEAAELIVELCQWMRGNVKVEGFLFELQFFEFRPFGHFQKPVVRRRSARIVRSGVEHIEQTLLPTLQVRRSLFGRLGRAGERGEERGAIAETIHRPGFDHSFDGGFWHHSQIDSLAEIEEVFEWAIRISCANDLFGRSATEAFYRRESERDLAVFHVEARQAHIHIRREHVHFESFRIGDVFDHHVALIRVVDFAGEEGRHELGREVRLEVRGLVADQGIRTTMRFVKTVAREEDDLAEDIGASLVNRYNSLYSRSIGRDSRRYGFS